MITRVIVFTSEKSALELSLKVDVTNPYSIDVTTRVFHETVVAGLLPDKPSKESMHTLVDLDTLRIKL